MENPWLSYKPQTNDYIHPDDVELVVKLNDSLKNKKSGKYNERYKIHEDIPPAPFAGKIQTAAVIILVGNPGYVRKEEEAGLYKEFGHLWIENAKMNYSALANPLFYNEKYINLSDKYWVNKLRLLREAVNKKTENKETYEDALKETIVSNNVARIQFYPYCSENFANSKFLQNEQYVTPTQKFSFSLVEEAMNRNAFIIIARKEKLWLKYVKGLDEYPNRITLRNYRNITISEGNCRKTEHWKNLVDALTIGGVN